MRAVLADAVSCIEGYSSGRGPQSWPACREALSWVLSCDRTLAVLVREHLSSAGPGSDPAPLCSVLCRSFSPHNGPCRDCPLGGYRRRPAGSQVTAAAVILLPRTDVEVKHGRLTVPQLKGSLGGVYPMPPDLIKLLRSYLNS